MVTGIKKLIPLFLFLFVIGIFRPPIFAEGQKKVTDTTRIMISVSGPTKYKHYQRKEPPALVIEFKTRNVFSQMDERVAVGRGVVKSIYGEYYRRGVRRRGGVIYPLKSLTFELLQLSPYKIEQTNNMIIVEIENPTGLKAKGLPMGEVEITDTIRTEEGLRDKRQALREAISQAQYELGAEKEEIIEGHKEEIPEETKKIVPVEKKATITKAVEGKEALKPQPALPILDKKKLKKTLVLTEVQPKPLPFKGKGYVILFAIIFIFGSFLVYRLRFQLLKKLFRERRNPTPKEQEIEHQLSGFQHLERISPTILGRLVLKGFEKMGYRVSLVKEINNRGLTSALERDNEKALFRFICKDEYFDQAFVEDFAKSMREEKVKKGYLVTTGAFTYPASTLAKEKSIELVGKEKLVELIHSYLEEDLGKELAKVKVESLKQTKILKDEVLQKEALLQELRDRIDKLSENENSLRNELKMKEAEYSELAKKHEDIRTKFEKDRENAITLVSEKDGLQQKIGQMQDMVEVFEKELAKYKGLEEQLEEKVKILEDERRQRQQLEERLKQAGKDIEDALDLAKDLEQKLAQKEREFANHQILEQSLAEKEKTLKVLTEEKENLHQQIQIKSELVSKLEQEKQELSRGKDKYIVDKKLSKDLLSKDRIISKLQREYRGLITKMEDVIFPSLNLTPLGEKGVLLKMGHKGPIVPLKRIGRDGVSFEADRRLDIPSPCNMTLIFFGSSIPLTVRGSLIWQEKIPGCLRYNVRLGFLSLRQNEKKKINEYINKTQKVLSKTKK